MNVLIIGSGGRELVDDDNVRNCDDDNDGSCRTRRIRHSNYHYSDLVSGLTDRGYHKANEF